MGLLGMTVIEQGLRSRFGLLVPVLAEQIFEHAVAVVLGGPADISSTLLACLGSKFR